MLGDRFARGLADLLQLRAALAEDDRLLAVALDQDLLVDHGRAVLAVLPFLGLDRGRIGQLGVELVVELLAGQLGRDHAVGGVGQLVVGEMPRPFAASRSASACFRSATPSPVVAETMNIASGFSRSDKPRGEGQQILLAWRCRPC